MNRSAVRRRLLLAESELNRARMVVELEKLIAEVGDVGRRSGDIVAICASGASLMTALLNTGRQGKADARSWLQIATASIGIIASLWRSRQESR